MLRMGVLNNYIAHLPSIFYSSKAVASTVKGNVIFGDKELAGIILASTPQTWQNQYNLAHSTVPESPCMLLPDLENIEQVMNKRYAEKQKAKGKSKEAKPDSGGNPSPRDVRLGARLSKSRRRFASRSFTSDARLLAALTRCTTPVTVASTTRMVSPSVQPQVSHPMQVSPTRNLGATSSCSI